MNTFTASYILAMLRDLQGERSKQVTVNRGALLSILEQLYQLKSSLDKTEEKRYDAIREAVIRTTVIWVCDIIESIQQEHYDLSTSEIVEVIKTNLEETTKKVGMSNERH